MNNLVRIGLYVLFILAGALFVVMGLLGAGAGFGHGGPSTSPTGLFLLGGIAAILTALYAIIRGLGKVDVSPTGAARVRFAMLDLGILVVLWVVCLGFGATLG